MATSKRQDEDQPGRVKPFSKLKTYLRKAAERKIPGLRRRIQNIRAQSHRTSSNTNEQAKRTHIFGRAKLNSQALVVICILI